MKVLFSRYSGQSAVAAALGAAVLFGASTPASKTLLHQTGPWMLAALLYLGSGLGLGLVGLVSRSPRAPLPWRELPWLVGAILAGGVVGPVLLMLGLAGTPGTTASLLMNAEGVFTALLAWFAFGENVDRRIALGMLCILAGAVVLSWNGGEAGAASWWPPLLVVAAGLCWALDNNLTRKVSLSDPLRIAGWKGLVAGGTNLGLALLSGADLPTPQVALAAGTVGFFGYGVSLVLFVLGLRGLGTARAGAYFSAAPFIGAALSVPLLGEAATPRLGIAGLLMAVGLWLHLTENHEHEHVHEAIEHDHPHDHSDPHHRHDHAFPVPEGTVHSHPHHHAPLRHSHPHYPDSHHRHLHDHAAPADESGTKINRGE